MRANEWDRNINLTSEELEQEESDYRYEELLENRRRAREARGYFEIDYIPAEIVFSNFSRHTRLEYEDRIEQNSIIGSWNVNKVWWICHDCGTIGFKQGDAHELFRCYGCCSRNVSLVRAGDISMLVREHHVGIKMEDIYARRKERLRRERTERTRQEREPAREA